VRGGGVPIPTREQTLWYSRYLMYFVLSVIQYKNIWGQNCRRNNFKALLKTHIFLHGILSIIYTLAINIVGSSEIICIGEVCR
jgi:hypothetical protein